MTTVKLEPYLRPDLDLLFVALNPSDQSNANGHYFSGRQSRFFRLLHLSGLIDREVDKLEADERVFGDNTINYNGARFGVVDLVGELVRTDSAKVRPGPEHVDALIERIVRLAPRLVCVIHAKIRDAVNGSGHPLLIGRLDYGSCGRILRGCRSEFFLNYFPNGNTITDARKLEIFAALKSAI
jgi:G:T/U-mismatch repair DNA glycosylase